MPYIPPTLAQCVEKSRQDFQANLSGSNAWLFPNNVAVSAKVFGGLLWGAFRFLTWISKQILVSTCERDWLYLHGAELGVTPLLATPATGFVQVTGPTGLDIPNNTPFTRSDGLIISSTQDTIIPVGGLAIIPGATSATGAFTNTLPGMTLGCAVPGVVACQSLGVLGGTDAESVDAYRQRVLYKKRNPPAVGSPTDYVRWALGFPGVTRVFVTRAQYGPGTVGVQFMMDGTYPTGIPLGGDVSNLLAYLNSLAPSDASIIVSAPIAQPINITITNLVPDTTTVRQAVADELAGMFQRKGVFSTGLVTFPFAWIDEAISRAQGEVSHDLVSPLTDTLIGVGSIATLGTINYV